METVKLTTVKPSSAHCAVLYTMTYHSIIRTFHQDITAQTCLTPYGFMSSAQSNLSCDVQFSIKISILNVGHESEYQYLPAPSEGGSVAKGVVIAAFGLILWDVVCH